MFKQLKGDYAESDRTSGSNRMNDVINNTVENDDWWFGGRKLLLAEDDETNQLVAIEILQDVGIDLDIVNTGAEALRLVKKRHYDVVLMDIQMPEMDGMEATRQIRALGGSLGKIPVIAITAHALVGDQEKSFAAGMDGHVTKPFEPEDVYQELSRWISPGEKPAEVSCSDGSADEHTVSESSTIPGDEIPDLPGIDVNDGMVRMCDNWVIYKQVLLGFRKKQTDAADVIETFLRDNDTESAARHAHSLKGSSGNISAMAVFEQASAIENFCRSNKPDKAMALTNTLREKLKQVTVGLLRLEQMQAEARARNGADKSLDSDDLCNLLDQLESNLDSDLGKAQSCLETLACEASGTELSDPFEALEEAFNNFDMDKARQGIHQLKQQISAGGVVVPLQQQKKGA